LIDESQNKERVMTRAGAKKAINETLRIKTAGLFSDEYWAPVYDAFEAIRAQGFDLWINESKYREDANGNPTEKCWKYQINMEVGKPIFGVLTAHGAGTVADPLSRYDISAYVS
jgi:hypothetical protein